jgi:hypothetical protein
MKIMRMCLASLLTAFLSLSVCAGAAPTVTVISATMRPSTSLMDVVYRVDDSDSATVKVRALAFIDGTRSFAKILRPDTFVEGTGVWLGDAITTGVNHTLTWDVGADWAIDLGQLKVEILAMDDRGLLPLNWVTIPATPGNEALTISLNAPTDAELLDAMFWLYADNDAGLMVTTNGVLTGTDPSGVFNGIPLVAGSSRLPYATPYVLKRMNLDPADFADVSLAVSARTGIADTTRWHAANRPYAGTVIVVGWGYNNYGQINIDDRLLYATAIAAGWNHNLALKVDGTVVGWGYSDHGQISIPAGLTNVIAIAAGGTHSLALKGDGTVVGWGNNVHGQINIPAGLTNVIAIAAGYSHSLALKGDGTVIGWGYNGYGQVSIPAGLTNVTAIATRGAGYDGFSLALKSDGTVIGWGDNGYGQINIPAGLTNVMAIAAGGDHSLALKSDGFVVGWGYNDYGQTTTPTGLTNVTAIAAGGYYSLALKVDGTIVGWGDNAYGQINIPAGLTNVTAIAAGAYHSLGLKAEAE